MVVPRGFTVHGQRLWLTNDALGEEGMNRMNAEIESGARYLATARVDVIAYGCTTGSFYKGPGWDREMVDAHPARGRGARGGHEPVGGRGPALLRRAAPLGGHALPGVEQPPAPRLPGGAMGFEVLNLEAEPTAAACGQSGHQRSGPRGGRGVRLARVPARGRRAPLLVHRVAFGGGRRRRSSDGPASPW